jgi:D-alanyl-D-alanine carboxypeptidase
MRFSRRSLFGLAGAVLTSGPADSIADTASESRRSLPPDLRQRLLALMEKLRVPGFAVAAVRKGEVVFADGFGYASLPFRVPADERTLFALGSIGKHFTAALVLEQEAAGRISLERPIGEYVKDLPKQFAACPVHSLLSHTSGIPTYDQLPGMEGDRAVTRADFMKAIGTLPLDFAPGEAWAYSNTGFVILGRAVEDITKRTYRRAITQDLVVPAGFREGRVDDAEAIITARAEPYSAEGDEIRHALQMNGDFSGWPDGGMIVSARDAAAWEIGLQKGKPIPAVALERMTTPALLSTGRSAAYGFAWFTDRMAGRRMHYHSGSDDGFIAFWLRLPDEGIGVAAMLNWDTERAHHLRRAAIFEVAEHLAPGSTCWSLQPIHDEDPRLTERTRKLIAGGARPDDATIFAPEIARLRSTTAFEWATGLSEKTPIESDAFFLVEAFDEEGDGHVRRYRALLTDGPIHYEVGYDKSGRIFRIRDV